MGEPAGQLLNDGPGIRSWVHAVVIALQRADERLCRTVRLPAADRCRTRHQPDVAGERGGRRLAARLQ